MNRVERQYYCFALHGYKNDVLGWLNETISVFSELGLPLKSVSYDYNLERMERKSLKKFLAELPQDPNKLYGFNIFYGGNMKYPGTWEYGVFFERSMQTLTIFLSELDNVETILAKYLAKVEVECGYSYLGNVDYALGGGGEELGLYKENGSAWGKIIRQKLKDPAYSTNGKIRHVYPENIIDEKLFDYVSNELKKGDLKKIGLNNWLWTVPSSQLEDIGKSLYQQGLLLGA